MKWTMIDCKKMNSPSAAWRRPCDSKNLQERPITMGNSLKKMAKKEKKKKSPVSGFALKEEKDLYLSEAKDEE